ncbi:MAG: branched-chain amino acid ABC transporter permease [Actinobacteria bacterium]|nr:branched-chain amino acid ABC transporter permease [Actinomycetota bacterium]
MSERQRELQRSYRERLQRMRAQRSSARGKLREVIAKDAEPITSRWRALRAWLDEHSKVSYPGLSILLIAVIAFLPLLGEVVDLPSELDQATSGSVLARVMLFSLFALGLNVVVGFAGLLDLGYVAFWLMGSYTAAILTGAQDYSEKIQQGASFTEVQEPVWQMWMWLILAIALGVAIVTGIALGSPTLRLRGDYLAIVTLGFGEILRITANNLTSVTGGPRGVRSIPHPEIRVGDAELVWGTLLDTKYYWLLLALVILWIIAIRKLDDSRIGRAWVAIREDEVAAAAMGVPVVRMKLAAFAIGACTAGVGGVIYAEQVNFINPPTFSLIQSILILSMVVLGGMGSIAGSIVGAAALVIIPDALLREQDEYRFFLFGFVLVVIMIFRPQGLVPSKRRKAELVGGGQAEILDPAHARSS